MKPGKGIWVLKWKRGNGAFLARHDDDLVERTADRRADKEPPKAVSAAILGKSSNSTEKF